MRDRRGRPMTRLAMLAVVACGTPAPVEDPYAALALPTVVAVLEPPAPSGPLLVVPGKLELHDDRGGVRIAIDPQRRWQDLAAAVDDVHRHGASEAALVVHTPLGYGALPIDLPHALAGALTDERGVLALVAVDRRGQTFVNGLAVPPAELVARVHALAPTHVVLEMDRDASIATAATVLAAMRAAAPEVRFVPEPIVR